MAWRLAAVTTLLTACGSSPSGTDAGPPSDLGFQLADDLPMGDAALTSVGDDLGVMDFATSDADDLSVSTDGGINTDASCSLSEVISFASAIPNWYASHAAIEVCLSKQVLTNVLGNQLGCCNSTCGDGGSPGCQIILTPRSETFDSSGNLQAVFDVQGNVSIFEITPFGESDCSISISGGDGGFQGQLAVATDGGWLQVITQSGTSIPNETFTTCGAPGSIGAMVSAACAGEADLVIRNAIVESSRAALDDDKRRCGGP
jgi:hypothetical protein